MLVEIVTAPRSPACAMMAASTLILPRVQHAVRDIGEHAAQPFRFFDAAGSHQNRLARSVHAPDLVQHRPFFFASGRENRVRMIDADQGRLVGITSTAHAVDLFELQRLGCGRAGHAADLRIQRDQVLQRDRAENHSLPFGRDALLDFDRRVQSRGPAPVHARFVP